MPYIHKVFGRTVNKKRLVSETSTLLNQLNCCELRNKDNNNNNNNNNIHPDIHTLLLQDSLNIM
jgi:hypothetical protein